MVYGYFIRMPDNRINYDIVDLSVYGDLPEQECFDYIHNTMCGPNHVYPGGQVVGRCDPENPPFDPYWMGCLAYVNNEVRVSILRARNLMKRQIRNERRWLFTELDYAQLQAMETGADISAIVAQKQTLRDLPAVIDTMTDLDALKGTRLLTDEEYISFSIHGRRGVTPV